MDKHFVSNLLKGLISTSSGTLVTIVFHFVSILLMTRYVSKDVLGLYFLALAVVQLLKIIGSLGLDLTLAKSVAVDDKDVQQDAIASTLAARFIWIIALGLIFFAVGPLLLPIFDARLSDSVVTLIMLFAMTSLRELFLYLMQGVQQFKGYAFVEILSAILRVILLIAFHDRLSLQGLLVIDIISQSASFLVQLFVTRALLLSLSRKNLNRESLRSLSRFSAPLYLNNVLTVIQNRSSTFLIGALLTPASVAAYEVALKIPDGFMRLFNSFIVVFFPSLSNLFARGRRDDAQRIMNSSLVLLSAAIIFLVLVAFLFAEEIVLTLFSTEYLEVSLAFVLLMLSFYLRAISNILGYSLVSAGYSSAPVKANVVASAVNIVSSIILIQTFGYIGAVYSLLLMNITSQVIYERLLKRAQLAPRVLAFLKPVFLLLLAMGIYWLIGTQGILLRLLLVGLYIGACWVFMEEIREASLTTLRYLYRRRVGTTPV